MGWGKRVVVGGGGGGGAGEGGAGEGGLGKGDWGWDGMGMGEGRGKKRGRWGSLVRMEVELWTEIQQLYESRPRHHCISLTNYFGSLALLKVCHPCFELVEYGSVCCATHPLLIGPLIFRRC